MDEDYMCPICLDVLKKPVMHSSCENMFCEECVKGLTSCPKCRGGCKSSSDFGPVPKVVTNKILGFKVKCEVCGERMSLEAFQSHDKKCCFPCPFECGERVNCSTLEKHCKEGGCKNYLLSCPASKSPLKCNWHGHGGTEFDEHVCKCQVLPFAQFATYIMSSLTEIQTELKENEKSK